MKKIQKNNKKEIRLYYGFNSYEGAYVLRKVGKKWACAPRISFGLEAEKRISK